LQTEQIDYVVNIAASPYARKQHLKREHTLRNIWKKMAVPILYCNQIGAHTDIIFDGASAIYNENGWRKIAFEEGVFTADDLQLPQFDEIEQIKQALLLGIKDFFGKLNFKKAVIGLSGGIDSAIVAALLAEALGGENLLCVMMPSEFSSDHSVSDSEKLIKNLGCKSELLEIKNIYNTALSTLEPSFQNTTFGLAEENLQARLRAVLLMAISNKYGNILVNTSNKSESAVGYGTLYGDMCGALSVIGDLYKTEVYALAKHINKNQEIIPENIINKEPSAELRPDQKDRDSLPDYETLDGILFQFIDQEKSVSEIISQGFDCLLSKIYT
jgi:NAD+ synthase (glutamine-hydrolysing)